LLSVGSLLHVVHHTSLLLGVSKEKELLSLIDCVLRTSEEVYQIERPYVSEEAPGEDHVGLLSVLFLYILFGILIAKEWKLVLSDSRYVARLNTSALSLHHGFLLFHEVFHHRVA
jgi:hypothetical protein